MTTNFRVIQLMDPENFTVLGTPLWNNIIKCFKWRVVNSVDVFKFQNSHRHIHHVHCGSCMTLVLDERVTKILFGDRVEFIMYASCRNCKLVYKYFALEDKSTYEWVERSAVKIKDVSTDRLREEGDRT